MLIRLISLFSFFIIQLASAQPPSVMNRGGANGRQMPTGSFYGKVLETTTGKPIELASVQLLQNKLDTATKKKKRCGGCRYVNAFQWRIQIRKYSCIWTV